MCNFTILCDDVAVLFPLRKPLLFHWGGGGWGGVVMSPKEFAPAASEALETEETPLWQPVRTVESAHRQANGETRK